jgi:tetratricopeptide (TPR) repeat protein
VKLQDELFDDAVLLPPAEQEAFLAAACAGDSVLRQRIERMLKADRAPNPDWKLPALEAVARRGEAETTAEFIPRWFGRYCTTERIGSGGMGVVYKAVREDDEYRQTVAVKVLYGGVDTPDLVARFRKERQILAQLVHPNIARLLDGGSTEEGLPYLVLEFVDGLPLNRYLEETAPSLEDRLRLFQRIADAVQFAHRNLVVHCDIKPANILVERGGVPKLLDFGIAKVLDEARLSRTATAPFMTPEYASPEQVQGRPITTASDVYSLGVLFCLLITGRPPYEATHEFARAVCEQPLDTRELPGELANIVAMATRKEPERRYSSVEQFSADIERYLSHRPVIARRDTLAYRARKYIRRNRLILTIASVASLTVVAGLTVTLLQTRRAARRFDETRGLAHFLLFDTYDGMARLPGSTPLRRLVVAKAQSYLDSLARDAGSDPTLRAEIADSYLRLGMVQGYPYFANLGDTGGALASVEKSRALLESLTREYPDRGQFASSLSLVYRRKAIILIRLEKPDECLESARQAIAVLEGDRYPGPRDAQSWLDLASAQMTAGTTEDWRAVRFHFTAGFETAAGWCRKSIESLQHIPRNAESPGSTRMLMVDYATLGDTERNWGDATGDSRHYEAALTHAGMQMSILRSLPADDDGNQRDIADGFVSTGRVLGRLRRFAEAQDNYEHALSYLERSAASQPDNLESQQDLANVCNYRGETLARAAKRAEAKYWTLRAIPIYESVLRHDPDNRETGELLGQARTRLVDLR